MGHNEMMDNDEIGSSDKMIANNNQDAKAEVIIKDYFELKNALVSDDTKKAAEAGKTLVASLKAFDSSKYTAEQQSEHFKILSKDITDMVAITGTENTLYQQFCPMYDGGSAWLSMSEDIKNPYYGSKMLTCGQVQKEIN